MNTRSTGSSHKNEDEEHRILASQAKVGIVEIGVLNGYTSRILAESNPNVPVWGIDPIIPDSMNKDMVGSLEEIRKVEKDCPNYHFINDYSFNVVGGWHYPFDYIFIDGDHNYDGVKQDFEEWFPKLSQHGFVALHDSAVNRGGPWYWPGPSRLADELLNDNRVEYVRTVFSMTIFRKK
jgi:hypothetical protein